MKRRSPSPAGTVARRPSRLPTAWPTTDRLVRCLSLGLDVNARAVTSSTPLHEALRHPGAGPDLIEALLRAGADPAADGRGERAGDLARNPAIAALLRRPPDR